MLLRFSFGLLLLCSSHVLHAALPDFAQIVEERSPAVVKIIAEATAPVATSRDQMPELEELEQLPDFGPRLKLQPFPQQMNER